MKPSDPVNLACPACGRSPVTCMVPSEHGAYCGCDFCGHMWQQEGLFFKHHIRDGRTFRRRKTDWSGDRGWPADPADAERTAPGVSGEVPGEATPCSHCGRVDERHEREMRQLRQRIAELESDNALLESSAKAFGELAERLNHRIRHERRSGLDRRRQPRATPDRRTPKSLGK